LNSVDSAMTGVTVSKVI